MTKFALINHTEEASDSDFCYMAEAAQAYANDVCTAHRLAPVEVQFFPQVTVAPAGWVNLVAFAKPSGDGYLGFHDTLEDGTPYADIYLDPVPGKVVINDPSGFGASLAGVATHELAEAICDLYANLWSDGPLKDVSTGSVYNKIALEVSDYVQNRARQMTLSITNKIVDCSNFVFPEFFCSKISGKQFDYLGVLKAPCTIDEGGYAIVEKAGDSTQVEARARRIKIPHHIVPPPLWREHHSSMKMMSRTTRRLST